MFQPAAAAAAPCWPPRRGLLLTNAPSCCWPPPAPVGRPRALAPAGMRMRLLGELARPLPLPPAAGEPASGAKRPLRVRGELPAARLRPDLDWYRCNAASRFCSAERRLRMPTTMATRTSRPITPPAAPPTMMPVLSVAGAATAPVDAVGAAAATAGSVVKMLRGTKPAPAATAPVFCICCSATARESATTGCSAPMLPGSLLIRASCPATAWAAWLRWSTAGTVRLPADAGGMVRAMLTLRSTKSESICSARPCAEVSSDEPLPLTAC